MNTELFDYELPEELIALHPPTARDGGRLLVVSADRAHFARRMIAQLPELLPRDALLLLNDTRVIPARLRAKRPTGGAVEVLLVRELGRTDSTCRWLTLLRANKALRPGDVLDLGGLTAVIGDRGDRGEGVLEVQGSSATLLALAEQKGEMPLPPYIRRKVEPADKERYQTVFARQDGSVAAPTASLHFTPALLERLQTAGVETAFVTLHVGPGTFRPIAVTDTAAHRMDAEEYVIPAETVQRVRAAKEAGRPVIAVGTTVTRAVEGAAQAKGELCAGAGETSLFITPGYTFRVIDGLLTNFHLPRSTLLCLVSALATREVILSAYREAVAARYRFYSYGDAMLVLPTAKP